MIPTPADPVATVVFFLLVFTIVGAFFLFIHLFMGSFLRPNVPETEKLTIYECGEPTVGSAWVQFDVRYYVIALLFVVFDVEVAFFFPWATVFGKANQLAHLPEPVKAADMAKLEPAQQEAAKQVEEQRKKISAELLPSSFSDAQRASMGLMKWNDSEQKLETAPISNDVAARWASITIADIAIFFGVLMVGFAYLWRRGDIDWVRAYQHHEEPKVEPEKPLELPKPAPAATAPPAATH
jgi:NADH-quinone oxidoreductase subunit A